MLPFNVCFPPVADIGRPLSRTSEFDPIADIGTTGEEWRMKGLRMDQSTPNLPSRDFEATSSFYARQPLAQHPPAIRINPVDLEHALEGLLVAGRRGWALEAQSPDSLLCAR